MMLPMRSEPIDLSSSTMSSLPATSRASIETRPPSDVDCVSWLAELFDGLKTERLFYSESSISVSISWSTLFRTGSSSEF